MYPALLPMMADTSADSSRLNWRPRRFKWTRPFRRKTKSGFCACAITFQLASILWGVRFSQKCCWKFQFFWEFVPHRCFGWTCCFLYSLPENGGTFLNRNYSIYLWVKNIFNIAATRVFGAFCTYVMGQSAITNLYPTKMYQVLYNVWHYLSN